MELDNDYSGVVKNIAVRQTVNSDYNDEYGIGWKATAASP